MKPITENEDFKKAEALNYNKNEDKQLENYHSNFAKGAEWTQQFLQKEHEGEMERFAEWIGDNCKKMRHYWEYFGDGPLYTTTELLQLFRERDGK